MRPTPAGETRAAAISPRPTALSSRRILAALALALALWPDLVLARVVPFVEDTPITTTADVATDLALGDVDDDGDLDVLSASLQDDTIAWYANDGSGGTWTKIATGIGGAFAVAAADLDRDGDPDALAAASDDDEVTWFENDGGGGTWIQHLISTSVLLATTVDVGDVDGDGDPDVLSGSWDVDTVYWHENDGSGGTWTRRTVSTAVDATSVRAADLDADGDVDVLSASFAQGWISWHENGDGSGTAWTRHFVSLTAPQAETVHAADLDRDGDLDLLSASGADDTVDWYRNESIHWSVVPTPTATAPARAESPMWMDLADFDRDGDLDVLTAGYGQVDWHENGCGGT